MLLKIYLKVVSEYSKENLEKKFKIKAQDNFKINDGIFINSIVSFNYTDTVKIYTPDAPIHFVNGSLDNEKIILGIENPSSENTNFISKDIEFFFKNVQRVLYNFFYDYKHWLGNNALPINVYIIGHSLALSDGLILSDLMMKADTVTICYHNQRDMEDKIRNLYKILGDQKFSQHVNNATARPYIELVNQSKIYI